MQLYKHVPVRPGAEALVSQNTLQASSGFHCGFLLLAWWVVSTVAMQSVLRPQCWASEVPRPQKFLVLTQVEAWNLFMFLCISYMHSLQTAPCKRCVNSFSAPAGWLWFILFVLVAWCWPSESFRFWRTLYLNFFLDYFYLCYLLFTCLIFPVFRYYR